MYNFFLSFFLLRIFLFTRLKISRFSTRGERNAVHKESKRRSREMILPRVSFFRLTVFFPPVLIFLSFSLSLSLPRSVLFWSRLARSPPKRCHELHRVTKQVSSGLVTREKAIDRRSRSRSRHPTISGLRVDTRGIPIARPRDSGHRTHTTNARTCFDEERKKKKKERKKKIERVGRENSSLCLRCGQFVLRVLLSRLDERADGEEVLPWNCNDLEPRQQ